MMIRNPFDMLPFRHIVIAALLALAPLTAARAQQSYVLNAYIGNFGDNTVTVVDTATDTVTGTISAGYQPQGIAVAPDGSAAYFVNTGNDTVSAYDAASGTIVATIPVGNYPTSAALSPDGARLYVCNANDNSISIVNTVTDTVSATITDIAAPNAIAITPDGSRAYVATFSPGVTVLDLSTNAVIGTVSFFGTSIQVAISPNGDTAYVTTVGALEVIDTASNTVTAEFQVFGQFEGVAVTPDGAEAWAVQGASNEVLVIDAASKTLAATIPVGHGPNGISFSADGTKAFVIVNGDSNISVIDTATRTIVDQIPVGLNTTAVGGFIPSAPPASDVAAAILPGGRSVEVGSTATVFATLINTSANTLGNCNVALPGPDGLTFDYQTTDPATNALIGTPDTPVSIPGNGLQTFILSFQSSSPLSLPDLPLVFGCDGSPPAAVTTGVDTVDLLFSPVPVADIIALAATTSGNGVVTVPFSQNGAAAFAVASVNAGAAGSLTVVTDTGNASLPIDVTLCETDPSNGQCLAPPTATLPVDISADATPTFSFFVTASGTVPFAPGTSRIFVRFLDAANTSHGSTSVAVTTN